MSFVFVPETRNMCEVYICLEKTKMKSQFPVEINVELED